MILPIHRLYLDLYQKSIEICEIKNLWLRTCDINHRQRQGWNPICVTELITSLHPSAVFCTLRWDRPGPRYRICLQMFMGKIMHWTYIYHTSYIYIYLHVIWKFSRTMKIVDVPFLKPQFRVDFLTCHVWWNRRVSARNVHNNRWLLADPQTSSIFSVMGKLIQATRTTNRICIIYVVYSTKYIYT